jgi:hypothetical protein
MRGPDSGDRFMTDSHVRDVFIWFGRYLAMKGKLPRSVLLDEVAVRSGRVTKDIRGVLAMEEYNR